MNDKEIDGILKNAKAVTGDPDPEVLRRIADSIVPSLRPVRPLPPAWRMTGALIAVCAAVSLAGALRVGLVGFDKMDLAQRVAVFSGLAILVWAAARAMVAEMIPGSRRTVAPVVLLAMSCVALAGLFALMFHDSSIENFVSIGLNCLLTGLLHAVPAALLSWLVLRRGFAMNSVAAGLLAGMLGGLAGVGMLELHCPNFETAHLVVWHTAVVLLSAVLGAVTGLVARRLARTIA